MKLVYRIFVVLLLGIMVAMLFVSNGMLVKGTNKISKFVTNIWNPPQTDATMEEFMKDYEQNGSFEIR